MARADWVASVDIAGRRVPYGLAFGATALIYFALARLGLAFASLQESAPSIWPAAGFAVAILVIAGFRLFPAILIGAFAANALTGGLVTALPISAGNTLEAMAGFWLIRRFATLNSDFFPLARTSGITSAALLASVVSSAAGALTLTLNGDVDSSLAGAVTFTWWTGDVLGILLVTPFLLHLHERLARADGLEPANARVLLGKGAVVLAAPLATAAAFFDNGLDVTIFLVLPIMIAAIRWFGPLAATAGILATATLWIGATACRLGPFHSVDSSAGILNLQILLGAVAVAGLVLAEVRRVRSLIPHVIFFIGSLLATVVYFSVQSDQRDVDTRHLVNVAERIQQHITDRMGIYANALQGGASLYAASTNVRRQEWRSYVESLDLQRRYPGVLGIGVVLPADDDTRSALIASMRRDGVPDFAIKPVPNIAPADAAYPEHFVIVFIEPVSQNAAAVGLDLASERRRRHAALLARSSGKASMTAAITLVQDNRTQPGFLIYQPMYYPDDRGKTSNVSPKNFRGWVYSPLTARGFFSHAMIADAKEVHFQVYDGTRPTPDALVYDSNPNNTTENNLLPRRRTQLFLLGHEFTLIWRDSSLFDRQNPILPISLGAGLILFFALVATLIATLMSQKERADHIVEQVTADLAHANTRFALAVDCSKDVIWDHDLTTDQTWASPRMASMFGYREDEVGPDLWQLWRSLMFPEDYTGYALLYNDLKAGLRDSIDVLVRFRHRDGHTMHVQTRAVSVRTPDGRVTRTVGVDTDITPIVQLEQRLRAAISVMEDGFGLFDADDRIILFNDAFIDDGTRKVIGDPTGRKFEEILRAFAYHDMPVEDPNFDREAWIAARLERHRDPPEDPIEVEWGDGRVMRISERRTQDGGYVGIWTDVTEIKRAENRLKTAIESLNDGFALFDPQDRLVICNDGFLSGPFKEIIGDPTGMTFEEIYRIFVDQDPRVSDAIDKDAWLEQRLIQHRTPPLEPIEFRSVDGHWTQIRESRTPDGGYVGIWSDVTDLRRAEQRLQDAIESINEGFLMLDADGRYAVFNSQLLRLYPKTARFVSVGADFDSALRAGAEAGEYPDVDTPQKIDAFVAEWSARFRDPTPFQGAAPLAGGGWVLISHRPMSDGSCVNIYTDITSLKQREVDLGAANLSLEQQANTLSELAEELKKANHAAHLANNSKSQFLANMSHELRTPLNGILGFADMIRNEIYGKVEPDRYRDYADDIHSSGSHLLTLINSILDLSKVEAGKMTLNIDTLETASIIRHALHMVSKMAAERGIELSATDIGSCTMIHADETQARQILLNLLSNAVKFTPDGGKVEIAVRNDGDVGAKIIVSDTSIGMTPAEIKKALERFGQADASYTKSMPGTGLGLPLVEGLVKLHGGSLTIASEKGKGTTITVFLPWQTNLPRG